MPVSKSYAGRITHHDVTSYADLVSSKCQMPELLALVRCGSIAPQVLQQLPAGYTIAVQEALACTAMLLEQVCCKVFRKS